MHKRIPSDPEEQETEQILLPQPHSLNPPAPVGHVRCSQRSRGRVRLHSVPAHVAVHLDGRDREPSHNGGEEVEAEPGEICQAENTGNETGEARRELVVSFDMNNPLASERAADTEAFIHGSNL